MKYNTLVNILTELEGPTTLTAKNVSLSVHSSNNLVESLNNAITRDISCNTDTPTGFRSIERSDEYDSLMITDLNNHISSPERKLKSKVLQTHF